MESKNWVMWMPGVPARRAKAVGWWAARKWRACKAVMVVLVSTEETA